jgi:TolA-binding protein
MSNIAGYHFLDAWMFGLHQCGDCYIDLCIKTSNNNRIRVTMNGDKTTQLVSFGSEKVDRPDVKNFDLEQGNYGCTVTIGASYSSQKQELVGMIGDWSAKNEEVAKVTAGWLLRQSPVPGSDELGDLLDVVLLPPAAQQFLANKTTGDADQKLLQLTMKINEMSQQGQMQQKQLQLCEQHLQQASQEIEQLKSGDSVKLKLKQMDIDMLNTRIEHEERMRVLDNTTKKTIADQSNATRLETAAMGENTSLDKEELIHHHQANLKVLDHELDQAAQLGSQQFQTSEPTVNQ